jgi:hypothetical protein
MTATHVVVIDRKTVSGTDVLTDVKIVTIRLQVIAAIITIGGRVMPFKNVSGIAA